MVFLVEGKVDSEPDATLSRTAREHRNKLPRLVKRDQIVTPPHVEITDKNLRHSATRCSRQHFSTPLRVKVDPYLFYLYNTARAQKTFRTDTIRANRRRVHEYKRLGTHFFAPFFSGKPAVRQPAIPPSRLLTREKPSFSSCLHAPEERPPVWQTSISGMSFLLSSSPIRSSSCSRGMLRESGKWPATYSSVALTSTTTAFSRLISKVACVGVTPLRPPGRRSDVNTNAAPLPTANSTRSRFC